MTNTKVGLTGWLSPEGVFHPCEFGTHFNLAQEIMSENIELNRSRIKNGFDQGTVLSADESMRIDSWVTMGSRGEGFEGISHVYIGPNGLTVEQKEWIRDSWDFLDEIQQEWLRLYGELEVK